MGSNTEPLTFPKPKFITGGCLCNAIRYRVDFPEDHDFLKSSSTCQCTQCRKQTGSLFFSCHKISPASNFQFIGDDFSSGTPPAALKIYQASKQAERAFCGNCGSFIYWKPLADSTEPGSGNKMDYLCFTVGTTDPLYLFGEGADGIEVPNEGFGLALANGGGYHVWCRNEIKGVTDESELLGKGTKGRGIRLQEE